MSATSLTSLSTAPPVSGHPGRERARERRARRTAQLLDILSTPLAEEQRRVLREEVVLLNRPVAEAVAARYRERGVPEEDLRQAAYEGLIKAVERFDASLHHNLLTYAVPTIRGEVQRYFRDLGWTVRPPRRIQELQWRINRTTSDLRHELGHDPDRTEIVAALGVQPRDYDEAQGAYGAFRPTSLDRRVGEDSETTLGELLPVQDGAFGTVETRQVLASVLGALSERDRRIVYLRYWEDRKQREIGEELGITQMQVSRLLTRICEDLRRRIGDPVAALS